MNNPCFLITNNINTTFQKKKMILSFQNNDKKTLINKTKGIIINETMKEWSILHEVF